MTTRRCSCSSLYIHYLNPSVVCARKSYWQLVSWEYPFCGCSIIYCLLYCPGLLHCYVQAVSPKAIVSSIVFKVLLVCLVLGLSWSVCLSIVFLLLLYFKWRYSVPANTTTVASARTLLLARLQGADTPLQSLLLYLPLTLFLPLSLSLSLPSASPSSSLPPSFLPFLPSHSSLVIWLIVAVLCAYAGSAFVQYRDVTGVQSCMEADSGPTAKVIKYCRVQ